MAKIFQSCQGMIQTLKNREPSPVLYIKFNFTYIKLVEKGILKLPISDKELESMVDELIGIFKNGFEPKNKTIA